MKNIMLDLETMGTSPTAAIVAIGAVAFEPMTGELGASFYRTIDLSSSITFGGRVDGETVGWWLRQSDEARQAVMADPSELTRALMEFSAWCEVIAPKDELSVWGNGASFDNVILSSAYESVHMPRPWGKFRDRCYRTMKAVRRDIEIARVGTHHNALDDAKSQALHLSKIMMALQAPAQPEFHERSPRVLTLSDSLANLAGGARPASPTAGMNIAQRILHVGGRNNSDGYVEFGSVQAVEALVRQVLRDLPAAPAPAAHPTRWYMINNIGMATLCTDEYDARIEAANANEQYPLYRPHRAVQLVEVAVREGAKDHG